MIIIKSDGSKERFDITKVRRTCRRAGLGKADAEAVAGRVASQVKSGFTSRQVFKLVLKELERIDKKHPFIYRLRDAIAKIEPHDFERYIKKVLEANGYDCTHDLIIKGASVEHQVDLVVRNSHELFMAECKHHINPRRECGLGRLLQVQARFEDIRDGHNKGKNPFPFTQAWFINNTKLTDHAFRYAKAKGIKVTCWSAAKESLQKLVQSKNVYPVTLLNLDATTTYRLRAQDLLTIQDILQHQGKLAKIVPAKRAREILAMIEDIIR